MRDRPDSDDATTATRDQPADPVLRYFARRVRRLPLRDDLYRQRLASRAFRYKPVISLITPIYDTPPQMLDRMLQSVANQSYPYWEHCLVDDGSSAGWLSRTLGGLASREPRVRFRRREANGGIVAASNDALTLATGDFISMLDHDDELDPQALFAVAARLNTDPDTDIFYSDFDVIDRRGRHRPGWFLPDWSPELLLSLPILSHLTAFRRSLVSELGGWRARYEGSQDYDLALRATTLTDRIVHIPDVLYHWREWERSVASNPAAKPYAYEAAAAALQDHLQARDFPGTREPGRWHGFHAPRFGIKGSPLVSVILDVTTSAGEAEARASIDSAGTIVQAGAYDNGELVVLLRPDLARALADVSRAGGVPVRVASCDDADEGVRLNAGTLAARGDYFVFLTTPVAAVEPGWLHALLEYAQQAAIGAVGSRILNRDGALWHAGVVLPRGVPHLVRLEPMLVNCSAVGVNGMMTSRAAFDRAGGFRPAATAGHPDFDYCLRLRALGYRHLVTPLSQLQFKTEVPFVPDVDPRFVELWRGPMHVDPYYNPAFRQDSGDFELDMG